MRTQKQIGRLAALSAIVFATGGYSESMRIHFKYFVYHASLFLPFVRGGGGRCRAICNGPELALCGVYYRRVPHCDICHLWQKGASMLVLPLPERCSAAQHPSVASYHLTPAGVKKLSHMPVQHAPCPKSRTQSNLSASSPPLAGARPA